MRRKRLHRGINFCILLILFGFELTWDIMAAFTFGAFAFANAQESPQFKKLGKGDLPAPVLAAFEKAYPKANITGVEQEEEDGKLYFKIASVDGNTHRNVVYTADGKVFESEIVIAAGKLPEAVKTAVTKALPQGKIKRKEKLMAGSSFKYEIWVESAEKNHELMMDANGNVLKNKFVRTEATHEVTASVETVPVPNHGDAADDPAIWRHPIDPALSTIIGTDKDSGLAVYDLAGHELQFVPDGRVNNVDLRDGFVLGDSAVSIVTASNQSDNTIAIYRINLATRRLENVEARKIKTSPPYGMCMYHSPESGKFYYFVNSRTGTVEQWELFATSSGKVDAKMVRSFEIGLQPEGCVADDELGYFYLGVEEKGIWKYGAEPDDGQAYEIVDWVSWDGRLEPEIEGLTLFYAPNRKGFLIASSQGASKFVMYRREGNNGYVGAFKIVNGNGIDEVTETDGIAVNSATLGPAFPMGVFVAQDGKNDVGNQNFKLVSWQTIVAAMGDKLFSARRDNDLRRP
jgi:3-phytase